LRSPVAAVDITYVMVSDTRAAAAPPNDLESAEEIVARLERWVAASESPALQTAVPSAGPAAGPPPAMPPVPKERDDLLPSEPGWSAILNEDVTPFGLATVACLVTLLSFVAFGLRDAACASGSVLFLAVVIGSDRAHSALATRIIVGVAIGVAIACLS
jgi:hypothetical protein